MAIDWDSVASLIISGLAEGPQAVAAMAALYAEVRSELSAADQATIDAALANATSSDHAATAQADADLDTAAKK